MNKFETRHTSYKTTDADRIRLKKQTDIMIQDMIAEIRKNIQKEKEND